MGRRARSFSVRVGALVALTCAATAAYARWELRSSNVHSVPHPQSSRPRAERLASLSSSTAQSPFDVLVVGGGVLGLYCAVDAAQRGLRVALVEAEDFGGAHSSSSPCVAAGGLAYVQRAIRQRDASWLCEAMREMRAATVWRNVCPECSTLVSSSSPSFLQSTGTHSGEVSIRTLLPALHTTEMLELVFSAVLSSVLSIVCGPLQLCGIVRHSTLHGALPAMEHAPSGGVVSADVFLDGGLAAMALARTAEALGAVVLSYSPVCSVAYADGAEGTSAEKDSSQEMRSASSGGSEACVMRATIRDDCSSVKGVAPHVDVYARGILNCSGAWVDQVKELCPDNALDSVPVAIESYDAYSYIVVPRSAIHVLGDDSDKTENHVAAATEPSNNVLLGLKGVTGLQMSSILYSFSSVMALPWFDDCFLLGPCVSPVGQPAPKGGHTSAAGSYIFRSGDGYSAQRDRILKELHACGVSVDTARVLSCVTTVSPLLKHPKKVPWASDVLFHGYHVAVSRYTRGADLTSTESDDLKQEVSCTAPHVSCDRPFIHVYSGITLRARDIAEHAVDTLLSLDSSTFSLSEATRASLQPCRTHNTRLEVPPYMHSTQSFSSQTSNDSQVPLTRLRSLVADTYVEHLSDIIFRRTHAGFTSPADALEALPFVADIVGEELGWDRQRITTELDVACTLIEGMAVRTV